VPVKQTQQEEAIKGFREDFIKASEESKASLQKLLTLYEKDVTSLTDQSAKLKELYADGVISRQEYEKTTVNISEAQAKVDDVRKQIATTDIAIAEARRPSQPYEPANTRMAGSSQTLWTTGNVRIDALIRENGARYRVDAYLIYCVIRQESRFGSTALSVKGAQGLMQLMPGTAARYGVMNANDPAQNISGGTRYLRDLMQLFHGRIDLVLAGYNAGEGAVIKYGQTVPPYKETQDYVHLISQRYLRKPNPAPSPENPAGVSTPR
jgi:soluble lytic murein transglycosylase-like protein